VKKSGSACSALIGSKGNVVNVSNLESGKRGDKTRHRGMYRRRKLMHDGSEEEIGTGELIDMIRTFPHGRFILRHFPLGYHYLHVRKKTY